MYFYENNGVFISSPEKLSYTKISEDDYYKNLHEIESGMMDFPSVRPTMEERMQAVEADTKRVKSEMEDLNYILTGEVLNNAQ